MIGHRPAVNPRLVHDLLLALALRCEVGRLGYSPFGSIMSRLNEDGREALNSSAYAILGLLAMGAQSAYELTR